MVMAGSCWPPLATFSLIFATPMLLCGQDPPYGSSARSQVLAPDLSSLSYSVPLAPVRIPPSPNLLAHSPGAPGNGIFQQLVFQQLVRAAGIIFSGRVTFIGHAASSSRPDPSSTTVTFRVEHAIRGTSTGRNLTIHEWAGLWTSGERYRVGERVLLFLYSPGKLGLTSPVAGAMGRFAMDSQGQILMNPLHAANLAADPILDGKIVVPYADFVLAVRRSSGEK
jgi:hypothetical protein